MVGRTISKLAGRINLEQSYLRTASCVAIADYDDRVFGDQHFVVPGGAGVYIRSEGINAGDWDQGAIIDRNREQATATQNNQMIAMQLDDRAFVNTGMLHVGDRLCGASDLCGNFCITGRCPIEVTIDGLCRFQRGWWCLQNGRSYNASAHLLFCKLVEIGL